jgi:hypothetical protein
MTRALLCAVAAVLLQSPPSVVHFGQPVTWTEVDTSHLKGRPAQLAWSDDGSTIYLQLVEGDSAKNLKFRHYTVQRDGAPKPIDAEPIWAKEYWKWKSAKTFFGDPDLTIEVDTQHRLLDDVHDNRTVYLESGRLYETVVASKRNGGSILVNRLMLKGHIIGEFIDEQVFPGYTFGWSPRELGMIAFRGTNGHLTVMNTYGQTDASQGLKDVLLPGWSEDGESIACLERMARNRFAVVVIAVQ